MTTPRIDVVGHLPQDQNVPSEPRPMPEPDWLEFHAGPPTGDATRHLCAAAYLDRPFRKIAVDELLVNSYRVPAPTPGTDHLRVLYECLRARREDLYSAAAAVVLTLIGLVVSFVSVVVLVGIGVVGYQLRRSLRTTVTSKRWARALVGLGGGELINGLEKTPRVVDYTIAGIYVAAAFFLGVVGASVPVAGGLGDVALILPLFLGYLAIGTVFQLRRHQRLGALHDPLPPIPKPSNPRLATVFTRLERRQAEAETVYGSFLPFVGCGAQERPWWFTLDLLPAPERLEENCQPDPLDVEGLHARVEDALRELAVGDRYRGDLLRRLIVRDRVFRSGNRVDEPPTWLGGLSAQTPGGLAVVTPEWANALDERAHERIRHYVEARGELWQDQVVASVFVRVCIQGSLLYVEGLPYVLPPVDRRYQAVDVITKPDSLSDGFAAVARALRNLPTTVVGAFVDPVDLVRTARRTRKCERAYRKLIKHRMPVNHAPRISVREYAAEETYEQYFQYLDVKRFNDSVKLRVVKALKEELDRAGFETGKIRRIINTLGDINIGTMNIGSTINGQSNVFADVQPPSANIGD